MSKNLKEQNKKLSELKLRSFSGETSDLRNAEAKASVFQEVSYENKPRLFVDMDGTLAEWRNIRVTINEYEEVSTVAEKINKILTTPGYFSSLAPHTNVVEAVKQLIEAGDMEVYILSCVLPDTADCSPRKEKNKWLDKYLPEIDASHRIFVPDGEDKKEYVPGGIRKNDYLLDDYTQNLKKWNMSGKGIKILNNVNSSNNTWEGSRISFTRPPEEIASNINCVVFLGWHFRDENPEKTTEEFDYENFDFETRD